MILRASSSSVGRGTKIRSLQTIQWIFRAAADLGIASLKLEESSQLGFYYRATLKEGGSVPKNKNYTVLDQPKTGIRFPLSIVLNDQALKAKFFFGKDFTS